MSIDTTFHPLTATYAFDNSAVLALDFRAIGVTTWRVRAITAAGYFRWANANQAAPTAPVAPIIGTPSVQTEGVNLGQALYLELPGDIQLIGNAAFGTGSFEIQGGIGGVGG